MEMRKTSGGGDPNALTPSGEWLNSDTVSLREGLSNIKGKLYNLLYSSELDKVGVEECKRVLWEIYEECDTTLWGTCQTQEATRNSNRNSKSNNNNNGGDVMEGGCQCE